MPFTPKQHRTFQAIAHGFKPTKKSLAGISQPEARRMASEGVKRSVNVARKRHVVGRKLRRRQRRGVRA